MSSLILLPGLACDAELFRAQRPALSAHHHVHISDVHFRFDTLPEMAMALLAEHTGAHVFVGTSMGGMLALEVQHQAHDRVAGLALLGSTARPDTPAVMALRREAITLFEAGRMDEVLRGNVPFAFDITGANNLALVHDYLAMMRRAGAGALVRQNRAVMARRDQRPGLARIRCPLLVACGDADLLTPFECSAEVAAAVPQARLERVAHCGHMLTWEQPAAVNAVLLDWLLTL